MKTLLLALLALALACLSGSSIAGNSKCTLDPYCPGDIAACACDGAGNCKWVCIKRGGKK